MFLFGTNAFGQLGNGDNIKGISPLSLLKNEIISINNLNFSKIKKFSIGGNHNLILFENNTLMAFGLNRKGQCCITDTKNPENSRIINKYIQGTFIKRKQKECIIVPEIVDFKFIKIKNIFCGYDNSLILFENGCLYFCQYEKLRRIDFPKNEKITKIFNSSQCDYFFIKTKTNYNNSEKIYGFSCKWEKFLSNFRRKERRILTPEEIKIFDKLLVKDIFCGPTRVFVKTKDDKIYVFHMVLDRKLIVQKRYYKNNKQLVNKEDYFNSNLERKNFVLGKKIRKIVATRKICLFLTEDFKIFYSCIENYIDYPINLFSIKSYHDISLNVILFFENEKIVDVSTSSINNTLLLTKNGTMYSMILFTDNIYAKIRKKNPEYKLQNYKINEFYKINK